MHIVIIVKFCSFKKMRLNADLVAKSAQYLNPLNQFYIDLRGYQIPYLENLTATND